MTTGNFTCKNTMSEFLTFSMSNCCRRYTLFKMTVLLHKAQGSHSFTEKIQDFPEPHGKFKSRECLNIKKNGIYLQHSESTQLQSSLTFHTVCNSQHKQGATVLLLVFHLNH